MCEGPRQLDSSPVTTGDPVTGHATPTGTWQIQAKQTDRDLTGPGYRDHVYYWMPFDGDIGFHDALWQTLPFGSPNYAVAGSHGCVHLPMAAMAWLFQWTQVGTTVTVEN